MADTPKGILELIKKLMAHAASARAIGSIKEAEAFAAKAQDMMDEWKLGMSDVDFQEKQKTEPIGWQWVGQQDEDFPYRNSKQQWQVRLGQAIAYVNGCHLVLANGGGNAVAFIGRTTERDYCKALFVYLLRLAEDLVELCAKQDEGQIKFDYMASLEPWEDWNVNNFRKVMRHWKGSWYEGFSEAIQLRLYQSHRKMKHKATTVNNGLALVHMDKEKEAMKVYVKKQKLRNTSSGRSQRDSDRDDRGYERGQSTGKAVNLTPHTFGKKETSSGTKGLLN